MNYITVAGAAIAGWLWGAAYYGVLGKPWMRAQGINPEDCKGKKMPVTPMVLAFIASALTALMLECLIINFGINNLPGSIELAVSVAVVFTAAPMAVNYAFQNRKPMLTLIDSLHFVGMFIIQCVILTLFP